MWLNALVSECQLALISTEVIMFNYFSYVVVCEECVKKTIIDKSMTNFKDTTFSRLMNNDSFVGTMFFYTM